MDRRNFLKAFGIAGGTALAKASPLKAKTKVPQKEFMGILVDTTRCIGCQTCEEVCAEVNGLPAPDLDVDVFKTKRTPTPTQYTVINGFETEKGDVYVKQQCMHCNEPACASACLTKAMLKTEEGPVIWREDKCMGCRFCMVSCPFNMPKFEDDSPNPKIQKCKMCWERLEEGKQPACVENCPAEALMYGKRSELIEIAKERIYKNPDDYVHHIYGEHEVGGTGYLYLAGVPFEQLGFNTKVGTKPLPELTTEFLYSVPIVLTLWPAFLLGVSNATKDKGEETESEEE